ncbi:unnamed protein product [Bursaphelenchus xylophilus]|uniref:(pine wood nematode) hypothetical protein n=1 Tax=Bursaphelenchus xylophilus TaxID=6326 RepID=A0A1I7RNE0_BURXY|nr:unnamed protein product [Bursaphelenchus xylophilus]CAG9123918.1 unnamed protein product [Bursaphelenchus xylophilus]
MPTRIFFGRLPFRTTERDIEHFCRGFGTINDVILKKGFGFVDFENPRDAEDVVYELNGKELLGSRIVVENCKPGHKPFASGGSSRGGGRDRDRDRDYRGGDRGDRDRRQPKWLSKYGPPEQTRHRLVVENLSTRCSWQDLKDMMRAIGEVTYAHAHKPERNTALVCFTRADDVKRAIEKFQGKEINGRKIKLIDDTRSVSRSRSRSRSRSPRRSPSPRSRSRSPIERSRSRS